MQTIHAVASNQNIKPLRSSLLKQNKPFITLPKRCRQVKAEVKVGNRFDPCYDYNRTFTTRIYG